MVPYHPMPENESNAHKFLRNFADDDFFSFHLFPWLLRFSAVSSRLGVKNLDMFLLILICFLFWGSSATEALSSCCFQVPDEDKQIKTLEIIKNAFGYYAKLEDVLSNTSCVAGWDKKMSQLIDQKISLDKKLEHIQSEMIQRPNSKFLPKWKEYTLKQQQRAVREIEEYNGTTEQENKYIENVCTSVYKILHEKLALWSLPIMADNFFKGKNLAFRIACYIMHKDPKMFSEVVVKEFKAYCERKVFWICMRYLWNKKWDIVCRTTIESNSKAKQASASSSEQVPKDDSTLASCSSSHPDPVTIVDDILPSEWVLSDTVGSFVKVLFEKIPTATDDEKQKDGLDYFMQLTEMVDRHDPSVFFERIFNNHTLLTDMLFDCEDELNLFCVFLLHFLSSFNENYARHDRLIQDFLNKRDNEMKKSPAVVTGRIKREKFLEFSPAVRTFIEILSKESQELDESANSRTTATLVERTGASGDDDSAVNCCKGCAFL